MHFVITGASGFIGSHVTEQLLLEGHRVTAIDDLSTGSVGNLPIHSRLQLLRKNIFVCHPEDLLNLHQIEPIHGIAHLAATPSVVQSWIQPLEAHQNNLSTTLHVIQLCRALNVPRLVFASSAAVYGSQISLPIAETQVTYPTSPYGLQKLGSEQYGCLFAKQFGFSFVALRLFNVFGERQSPNSEYSGVISLFLKAMQQQQPLTVYGDGTQTRDFIYVKDVARAFVKALTVQMPAHTASVFNIGTGDAISINQLIHTLQTHFPDWRSSIHQAPSRPGDIRHSQASITKAYNALDFVPTWSVQTGLALYVKTLLQEHVPLPNATPPNSAILEVHRR